MISQVPKKLWHKDWISNDIGAILKNICKQKYPTYKLVSTLYCSYKIFEIRVNSCLINANENLCCKKTLIDVLL